MGKHLALNVSEWQQVVKFSLSRKILALWYSIQ